MHTISSSTTITTTTKIIDMTPEQTAEAIKKAAKIFEKYHKRGSKSYASEWCN